MDGGYNNKDDQDDIADLRRDTRRMLISKLLPICSCRTRDGEFRLPLKALQNIFYDMFRQNSQYVQIQIF